MLGLGREHHLMRPAKAGASPERACASACASVCPPLIAPGQYTTVRDPASAVGCQPETPVSTRRSSAGWMRGLIQLTAAAFGRTAVSTTCRRRSGSARVSTLGTIQDPTWSRSSNGTSLQVSSPGFLPPRNQPRPQQSASRANKRSSMLVWKISSPWMVMFRLVSIRLPIHVVAQVVRPVAAVLPDSGRRSPASMAWTMSCGFRRDIMPSRTSGVPCWRPSVARARLQTSRRLPTLSRSTWSGRL